MELTTKQEKNLFLKIKILPNDCWAWIGALNKDGYGMFFVNNKPIHAHRIFHEYFIGPIPESYFVDHLCRNHSCVNPAHLEAVTPKENTARGVGNGSIGKETTKCLYGHFLTKENTYKGRDNRGHSKRLCKTCDQLRILKFKQKAS